MSGVAGDGEKIICKYNDGWYAALKQDLIKRWHDDRKAYGEAKTAFVLDTLETATRWAETTGWHP